MTSSKMIPVFALVLYVMSSLYVGVAKGEDSTIVANNTGGAITAPREEYFSKTIIKGQWGNRPGEFGLGASMGEEGDDVIPKELTQDDNSNIYVLDSWNNRIQKFSANGKYIEEIPISAFVRPTHKEFNQSAASWNKKKEGFIKTIASGMAWVNGQLIVYQKQISEIAGGRSQKVLVLKSGKFAEVNENVWKEYKGRLSSDIVDAKGNKYVQNDDMWQKIGKDGEKVFEFNTLTEHKYGRSKLNFRSTVNFDKKGDCFLEMRPFSNDENDWGRVFLPNGGGMQIIKWCKK